MRGDEPGNGGRRPARLAPQFEVLPFESVLGEAAELPGPTALTVTCSPRHGTDQAVEFGTRLRELGHTVTVHIGARMVRDRAHADVLLRTMADAGIQDAFVIGGDTKQPLGEYASAGDLLEAIADHPRRPSSIGVAAYPEGHPVIDAETLEAALDAKAGLASYMATQMCFDPDALTRWLRGTRARGVQLPVRIGIPGEVDRRRLLEISMRIGVGSSLAFLRKQRGIRKLLSRSSLADRLFDALAPSLDDPDLAVIGFHYFTFNNLVGTWNWDREKWKNSQLAVAL